MTYSSSLAVGRKSVFAGRNRNGVAFQTRDRALGPVSNTIILIVLALVLGMLYLAQATKMNAFGYRIDSLQKEAAALDTQHDDLQITAARLQSVARVQSSDQAKTLAAVAPSATVKQ